MSFCMYRLIFITIIKLFLQEGSIEVYRKLWKKIKKSEKQSSQKLDTIALFNVAHRINFAFAMDKILFITDIEHQEDYGDVMMLDEEFNRVGMGLAIGNNMPYKKKMDEM